MPGHNATMTTMNISHQPFAPLTPQVFHILLALDRRDHYGFGIKSQIAEDSGSVLILSDSTLYSALKRLTNAGFIRTIAGHTQPYYQLTKEGRAELESETRRLKNAVSVAERRMLARKYSVSERFY